MQFECPHFTLVRHRVPLAQWLEHPTRSRRVVGSNPIWCWDFFRVPFDAKNVSSSIIFNNVFNDIDCVKEKSENKQTTSIKEKKNRERSVSYNTELFHLHGQHLLVVFKFFETKESVYKRKDFNSHRTGLVH